MRKLIEGLQHPGDMERGEEPVFIRLPFFRQPSMPQEVHEQIDNTTRMLAEALVHAIETEGGCEIVPKHELAELRKELAQLKEGTAK